MKIDIARILVPVDFSECSSQALRYAASVAERFGAEVVLAHAIEAPMNLPPQTLVHIDPEGTSIPIMDYVRQAAERRMEGVLKELSDAGVKATSVIELGDVRDVVLAQAAARRCDLIVMGTNGRTGLRHLLIGSIAEDVVRRSSIPVLTIRVHDDRRSSSPPPPATGA